MFRSKRPYQSRRARRAHAGLRFAKKPTRPTSYVLSWLGFLVVGCAGLMVLFFAYVAALPDISDRPPPAADGIVVLTGTSPERVVSGLHLLADGRGQRLLISGAYEAQTSDYLADNFPEFSGVACCIDFDYAATTTVENATETEKWVRSHGYRSLILVTSIHHVPRALLEFKRTMPNVALTGFGVRPERIKFDKWWSYPGTFRLLIGEFGRYVLSMINLSL